MSFNSDKFVALRYGFNEFYKCCNYLADDGTEIEDGNVVRDLGVHMTCDAEFCKHIEIIVRKARGQAGWILRVFSTREKAPMIQLFKSMVIPLLEYCCQLWDPWRLHERRLLEQVQRSFTSRISGVSSLNYWQRLKALNMYSLERRRERYLLIYLFKIMNGLVPNVGENIIAVRDHIRRGPLCVIRSIDNRAPVSVSTKRRNFFLYKAPRLFNELPRHIREMRGCTVEKFKRELDKFLKCIPDQPKLPHYHSRAESNSIIDQLATIRAAGEGFDLPG